MENHYVSVNEQSKWALASIYPYQSSPEVITGIDTKSKALVCKLFSAWCTRLGTVHVKAWSGWGWDGGCRDRDVGSILLLGSLQVGWNIYKQGFTIENDVFAVS